MFGIISRWLARRRRNEAAVAAAIRHFEKAMWQRAWQGSVIAEDGDGLVVRVCFGRTRPPHRAWYRIGTDGTVTELPVEHGLHFDQAVWR